MMPFLYPIRSAPFPILVIGNSNRLENNEDDNENFSPRRTSTAALANLIQTDEEMPSLPSTDHQVTFSVRLNVDGFRPDELNVSIRHGRLIVRGRHVVRTPISSLTTNSINHEHEDFESDFVAKEFKRTFSLPSNVDIPKAHAQFYPQRQLLLIEIPFQNITNSSETRIHRIHLRPIEIFLAIIAILSTNHMLHRTYEQLSNPQQ